MNKDLTTNMFSKLSLKNLILQTILNYISETFLEFILKSVLKAKINKFDNVFQI
jgi:hypothetical protein